MANVSIKYKNPANNPARVRFDWRWTLTITKNSIRSHKFQSSNREILRPFGSVFCLFANVPISPFFGEWRTQF